MNFITFPQYYYILTMSSLFDILFFVNIVLCTSTFYAEAPTYHMQTVKSLPSYWSMAYDPDTQVTTLTIKGMAERCKPKNKK